MANKHKAKGTTAETAVNNYLNGEGLAAYRLVLHGSKDVGDIQIPYPLVIEVKNHRAMDLGTWMNEAQKEKANAGVPVGVVWHKRVGKGNPAEWYVSMTGEDFVRVLKALDTDKL